LSFQQPWRDALHEQRGSGFCIAGCSSPVRVCTNVRCEPVMIDIRTACGLTRNGHDRSGEAGTKVTRGRMPVNFFFIVVVVVLIIIGVIVLSGKSNLKTEAAKPADVQGEFTLLLYGCSSPDDLANIAILDKEGDPYSFEIYAPDFSYTIKAGLSGAEALQEAERFVRCNVRSERSRLCRVLSPAGAGIGFELRPLYSLAAFGKDDVLDVRYLIKDRKIVVHIELDPAVALQETT
jgi:hypothetical protein